MGIIKLVCVRVIWEIIFWIDNRDGIGDEMSEGYYLGV